MFSLVNSSSCSSSKDSQLRTDERDSDQLPFQEARPVVIFEAHNTNFSIRGHVLASRSKNICANWPFPPKLLQICLKNGIRDVLPPFEPHSSVKSSHCLLNPVSEAEEIAASSAQLEQTLLPDDGSGEACCLSEQHKLNNLVNDACGIETVLKKCGPVQRSGAIISETSREEDIISSSTSMSSDVMASKTCPVCKAFSSTSNTTLNAHMDQCLSMDSDATLAAEKVEKIKVIKPRKKRLMVDIYATASLCTLEDLDRRNGTSWATDLNCAVPAVEKCNSEAKKPKLADSDTRDDSGEGAVYVDSNGIKIRILSKFNDAKNVEVVGDGNTIISTKKDHFGASSSKKMKLRMRNKKLRSLKLFKSEVQAGPEASHHNEESRMEEEGSPVNLSGELDKSLCCGSATLKNWPSSKRSELPKKSGKKNFHKIFAHLKPASDAPAPKVHFGNLSRLLDPKLAGFPSNAAQNPEKERSSQGLSSEGASANARLLKLSRTLGVPLVSLPRSSGEEVGMRRKHKSHSSPKSHKRSAETCHLLPKSKKMSTLSAPNSSSIKTGKHRSLLAWTDTQTRTSKILVDQGMGMGTLTRASSENAADGSIMLKPLVDEDQDSRANTNVRTSLMMTIGSMEQQADKQAQDQLEDRRLETQAKAASAQEFSACLNGHELSLDITLKNFSKASEQGHNLAGARETLVSPASSASTISPSSPNDYHSKASEIKPASNPSAIQDNLSFPLPFMPSKEGNHGWDIDTNEHVEKPCCCSWQSLSGSTKQKPVSNLYIRPSISCFYAYSNSRTDASIAPSMESPTESILTKAFSDVGSTSPSCGTPTQSSSNSILRLMGKDLMVVNNEEPAQIPKIHSQASVRGLPSQFSFSSYANVPNHNAFSFVAQDRSPSMVSLQERNLLPDFCQSMNHQSCVAKEVIVIDDSDEVFVPRYIDTSPHTVFQRPSSYFPQHSHLLPRDNTIQPSSPINQGSPFPASHLLSPFMFQSPSATRLNSPFHYPQSFR